jgi:sugar O-acyltransferase (sialic acid O-acetyltransferase NeuD family)
MARPVVIFGYGNMAEVAHYYFTRDSDRRIAAFTIDRPFITETTFCGLPVVPFDDLTQSFPVAEYDMFVAVGYSKINAVRREKYLAAKVAGYGIASYVSTRATILNEGRIGENCLILEDNTVQPFATIGNNVFAWSGNHIGHHSVIGDHCFLASHIVVSGGVEIGESCFIGVNATLRDHIKIGARCVIGAGALLLADAEPEGVYVATETERSRVPSSRIRRL